MKKTLKLSIKNHKEIFRSIGRISTGLYNTANYQRIQAWKETGKIPNYNDQAFELKDNKLSRLLHSQVAQQTLKELERAYRSWFSLRKQDPEARPPKFRKKNTPVSTWWTPASFKIISNDEIRFTIRNLDIPEDFIVTKISTDERYNLLDLNVKMINVVFEKDKVYACLCCEFEELDEKEPENVIAIDLGIKNIIASTDLNGNEEIITGGEILSHKRYAKKKTGKLQSKLKGEEKSSKTIRKINQKISRQVKHKLHMITKHIAKQAKEKNACVVVGDLKGLRKNKRKKKVKNEEGKEIQKRVLRKEQAQEINDWNYSTFTSLLEYKCKEKGVKVFKVSERYTSRTCPNCGIVRRSNRVKRGLYKCKCGYLANSDITGARNILTNFLNSSETNVSLSALRERRVVANGTGQSMTRIDFHELSC